MVLAVIVPVALLSSVMLPAAPPVPTPATAAPPLASRLPLVKLMLPPVAVTLIAPAFPPRALARVCAAPPLAVINAPAAARVIVTLLPVKLTLPASVP